MEPNMKTNSFHITNLTKRRFIMSKLRKVEKNTYETSLHNYMYIHISTKASYLIKKALL